MTELSLSRYGIHLDLHSFPTRRSSDLLQHGALDHFVRIAYQRAAGIGAALHGELHAHADTDRKSTRLNSSHSSISYAVFCLKKKTLVSLLQSFCGSVGGMIVTSMFSLR